MKIKLFIFSMWLNVCRAWLIYWTIQSCIVLAQTGILPVQGVNAWIERVKNRENKRIEKLRQKLLAMGFTEEELRQYES